MKISRKKENLEIYKQTKNRNETGPHYLDPSYQSSKKREFDKLEKIRQFYQPSSCLSKKKRLFQFIFPGKTYFSKKKLKINAPNSFFENESNFFYMSLEFFNMFLKT